MRDYVPSATALRVAALRALHQTSEVPPVFVDPLAGRILWSSAAKVVDAHRTMADETRRLRATDGFAVTPLIHVLRARK